jgi:hypothetical protein
MHSLNSVAIRPNLELKTQPKQLLGSLPLDIALPGEAVFDHGAWHRQASVRGLYPVAT